MRVQGEFPFVESRERVWQCLLDPTVIAKAVPGCEELSKVGDNEYSGSISVRLGPVQGRFEAGFALSDLIPPESYVLKVNGRGTAGFVEGQGSIRLEEEGAGTRMFYDFEVRVAGKVASVGQRLLDSSAKLIVRQGLDRLKSEISARCASVGAAAAEFPGKERGWPWSPTGLVVVCVFLVTLGIIWVAC